MNKTTCASLASLCFFFFRSSVAPNAPARSQMRETCRLAKVQETSGGGKSRICVRNNSRQRMQPSPTAISRQRSLASFVHLSLAVSRSAITFTKNNIISIQRELEVAYQFGPIWRSMKKIRTKAKISRVFQIPKELGLRCIFYLFRLRGSCVFAKTNVEILVSEYLKAKTIITLERFKTIV